MSYPKTEKITCPKCGHNMSKSIYESRHKSSKKCKQYQKFNKM